MDFMKYMIPRKKKICKGCGNEKYIFGKGLCDYCYKTKQKKIKPISESHKKTLNEYKPIREAYLLKHKYCEANLKRCTKVATEIHHKASKIGKLYTDDNNFLAVCRNCHTWIEENPKEAKELGFSENRL